MADCCFGGVFRLDIIFVRFGRIELRQTGRQSELIRSVRTQGSREWISRV